MNNAAAQLDHLQQALTALRAAPHTAAQFAQETRHGTAELLAALPTRYAEVVGEGMAQVNALVVARLVADR